MYSRETLSTSRGKATNTQKESFTENIWTREKFKLREREKERVRKKKKNRTLKSALKQND